MSTSHASSDGLFDLMQRYVDGDRRAFDELYRRITPRLRALIRSAFGSGEIAEDLIQVTMLKAHLARGRFRPSDPEAPDHSVFAWYAAIAKNVTRDHLRRRQRSRVYGGGDAEIAEAASSSGVAAPSIEEQWTESELERDVVQQVHAAMEGLKPTQREVVDLHKLQGLSMAEVATRLNVREGAVRVRAHRAYRALALLLSRKPIKKGAS